MNTIFRLKAKEWTKELPKAPTSEVLDPLLIDPLGRTRLKRLKTRPWTPGDKKPPVILNIIIIIIIIIILIIIIIIIILITVGFND